MVVHSHAIEDVESIRRIRFSFVQEHAAFETLFFPFISVVVIKTYMTELVENGDYRRIPPSQDF